MLKSDRPTACPLRRAALPAAILLGMGVAAGCLHGAEPDPPMTESPIHFPGDLDADAFLELLHTEHPRLFATGPEWDRVREAVSVSDELGATLAALRRAADEMLELPPLERELTGRRLLDVSRKVLKRVFTLGTVYRIDGDPRHRDRLREELLRAASFEDWNPSHFLDVAEMTLAVATGYDWLHGELSAEERAKLREAIVAKGLEPGREDHWWKRRDNNWNQVCYGGLIAGALAIGRHDPGLAVELLHDAYANIHRPLDACRPDGAYPEGPTYWSYGTHYQVILLSVLKSALGTAWNLENYPGFRESAVYVNLMIGPSGRFYNYADGRERVRSMPALHWFASRAGNPALDAGERDRLARGGGDFYEASGAANRFFPLTLLWLDPDVARIEGRDLPLHWLGDGPNPVAVHRSSPAEDALYLGIKGGSPSVNHGHMDVGSFVLDWKGVRWASDLGMQGYHSLESIGMDLWNRAQDSDRWRVFRLNTFSHNTLVFDGRQQLVDGFAPVAAFSDDPAAPFTVVDMTGVYRDSVDRALRGARLLPDGALLLHDQLWGFAPEQEVRWGMVTRAEIGLDGNRAVLRLDGRELHVALVQPADAAFEIVPTDPPPNDFDDRNPGTRMLAFFARGGEDPRSLRVLFSGERIPAAELEERLSGIGPPGEWRASRPMR